MSLRERPQGPYLTRAGDTGTGAEIVVDASVAAKWLLRDEEHLMQADAILRAYDEGTLTLYAPRQIDVEMAAVLRKAVLQRRLSAERAAASLQRWFALSGYRLSS